ncbi:hypothetical protein HXA34_08745 [Salipaludibacillus agaradhaerens]|uniref:hypothetical protein n=2 Tax=Salipaludibacillus agaradhaerens TaxID=76935 RepID=UPI002151F0C5|nr:hypothetical protein [Salipaludibacillus agaradhaerens]MCR6106366.1 hypothetical protein [Salipaludibacillus agaradhaerens]MCR6118399.1 hypothetical protein [Salipaludibacillus agaradhaerens]
MMELLKNMVRPFITGYLVKGEGQVYHSVQMNSNVAFQEVCVDNLAIKRVLLPDKNERTRINKLLIYNMSSKIIETKMKVHYYMNSGCVMPFVYYSPHYEAMVACTNDSYYVTGGMSQEGGPIQYQTNMHDMNASAAGNATKTVYQPLTKHSDGWSLTFDLRLLPYDQTYMYDWELSDTELVNLEKEHLALRQLFN